MKKLIWAMLDRLGFELCRGASLNVFLVSRDVDFVFDVGANVGQFAAGLRTRGYGGDILSFEPMAAAFETLRSAAARDPRWSVERAGLGAVAGELELNVSALSVFNSFLPQTELAQDFDSRAAVVRRETVPVRPLDDYLDRIRGKSAFLKIDTQGFEQQVLAGGARVLEQVQGLQLELPVSHLYEGVWSMEEALAEMRRLGFAVAQVRPVNMRKTDRASLLEIDCVFRRA